MSKYFIVFLTLSTILFSACGKENVEKSVKIPKEIERVYVLPAGMKVVNVTDKSYNDLGILMRPMRQGEKAETYIWKYLSGGRIVTIKETEQCEKDK